MLPKLKLLALLATAGVLAGAGVIIDAAAGPPPRASAAEQSAAAAPVRQAIPGADATLTAGSRGGGYKLKITAPPGALALAGTDDRALAAPAPAVDADALAAAQLGWRAQLAAAVAAERDPAVTGFTVTPAAITTTSPDQRPYFTARLRSKPGAPLHQRYAKLGSVSRDEAEAQLASNISVLRSALPAGTIERIRIVPVVIDGAGGLFGLEVDIKVTDMTRLSAHLGDVIDGLATGLAGNPAAVVEGLAINVIDDQGRRAGWWRADRAGIGMGIPGPVLAQGGIGGVDRLFPNLTGGPSPIRSIAGK